MAARWSCAGVLLSAALAASCGCGVLLEPEPEPRPEPPPSVPGASINGMFRIISLAVQRELRPAVSKLESQMESMNSRQSLLESMVSVLTTQTLKNGQSHQTEQLSSQLASQQSQLNEVRAQLNGLASEEPATGPSNEDTNPRVHFGVRRPAISLTRRLRGSRLGSLWPELDDSNSEPEQESAEDTSAAAAHDHAALFGSLDSFSNVRGARSTDSQGTTQRRCSADRSPAAAAQTAARDCSDLHVGSTSGTYLLQPSNDSKQSPVEAYCDMDTTGGNWTVIQRRADIEPRQDFYLGWTDYKEGFGNVAQEFWWGLEHLYQLTSSGRQYELRIDLEAFDGNRSYAIYQGFRISSEVDGYRLSVTNYSGTAGDGLMENVNYQFSTEDRDSDHLSTLSCARVHRGAWWYGQWCGLSNLNGRYSEASGGSRTGIWWFPWRAMESLKKTEMKIRPT
ncbi:techylectin-5B-like [Amphibalanus amphitrite]|uniref:techylectin-5B-like n=1 Tax=Amphibalanus amphitrite TaxID=1232801 RepID=UPI001C9021E4|nr:techylectin-5B-like [Amphibalanus amphitrite]